MRKIILLLIISICPLFLFKINCAGAESIGYVRVIYSSINVFADTDYAVDFDGDLETLDIIYKCNYGTKLQLVEQNSILGNDGLNYYKVKVENGNIEGFVLCSQVLMDNISSPQKHLDYNASVNKDAKLYVFENQSYVELEHALVSGQQIKILDGYNNSKQYTKIQYKSQDGYILTAYIKTSDISVSGVSKTTIGAIIIVITTISLALVVFGVKGKRKKKLKNKKL